MSKPNNTNTTQPSYIPPSPDPRFVETPSSILLARGFASDSQTSNRRRKRSRRKVWTDPKTGETSVYPYTAVESPPQSTPNDKELIELEQETAAPWVTGKKAMNQNQSPEQASEFAHCRSTPDTEEDINTGRRYENTLENLGGGFLRNNVEGEDFEEVEGVGNERGQGEEEEEEREEEEEEEEEEYVEEKERESGPFERETTWKGIATEEEEVLEIDEGFVVAEKEVRLDANEVPEEKIDYSIGVQTMKRRLTCFENPKKK
ncbi:hypothetical protein PSHT_11266 [Puccinia striiformis]|uniref:Uncharacterized protein n=1 Tax=Puccinia striiformis TaxID=27350 RepID=A0A2S4V4E1_9BASI|nr:hypothetical protein PSHT_11266 [Puccinia striiformis]